MSSTSYFNRKAVVTLHFNRKAVATRSPGLPLRLPWGLEKGMASTATRLRHYLATCTEWRNRVAVIELEIRYPT